MYLLIVHKNLGQCCAFVPYLFVTLIPFKASIKIRNIDLCLITDSAKAPAAPVAVDSDARTLLVPFSSIVSTISH